MGTIGGDLIMHGDELQGNPSIRLRRKAHMTFRPPRSLYFGMFSDSTSCKWLKSWAHLLVHHAELSREGNQAVG